MTLDPDFAAAWRPVLAECLTGLDADDADDRAIIRQNVQRETRGLSRRGMRLLCDVVGVAPAASSLASARRIADRLIADRTA